MTVIDLIGPVDMRRPWSELDEQFRTAYWRAHTIRPRRPYTEAVIPPAAVEVHRRWTLAMNAHPDALR